MSIRQLTTTTLLSSLLLFTSSLHANTDRANYTAAKNAFDSDNNVLADQLTAQLTHYPLYPYLQLRQFKRDIATVPDQTLRNFLETHKHASFADDAQRLRLEHLRSSGQWQAYLNAYADFPLKGDRYQCELAEAQLHLGDIKTAMNRAEQLWTVGYSQDSRCDPLFDRWIGAGHLTSALALERFWRAVEEKNYSLADYVERFITEPAHKEEVKFVKDVRNKPELIHNATTFSAKHPHHGMLAAQLIRDLARKDINEAAQLWLRDRDRLQVSADIKEEMNLYFGRRYAKGYRSNAKSMLAKLDPHFHLSELTEWRIRLELAEQDWKGAKQLIAKLPEDTAKEDRWIYWRETVNYRLAPTTYQPDYRDVIKERSFYGFLASEITGQPFRLNHRPVQFDEAFKAQVLSSPAMQRIQELRAFGLDYAARVEWNHMARNNSEQFQQAAAHIAFDWQWYDQAIRGVSRIKAWDDLSVRFPSPHQPLFEELAKERGIYQTWAVAVARQESAYLVTAKSRVGARGLMQLMPATAKMTAKKFSVDYTDIDQLYTPRTNISLGTAYLAEMLETFNGNRVYATAAYNAGPHRVKSWLNARGDTPLDVWIETIPFDETRNYVQNVLAFIVIYDALSTRTTSLLNEIEIKALALNTASLKKSAL